MSFTIDIIAGRGAEYSAYKTVPLPPPLSISSLSLHAASPFLDLSYPDSIGCLVSFSIKQLDWNEPIQLIPYIYHPCNSNNHHNH